MTDDSLTARWKEYRREHPNTRHRQAASDIGVPEGALIAGEHGIHSIPLRPSWKELLGQFAEIGPLLALTRNEGAVSERTCIYGTARSSEEPQGVRIQDSGLHLETHLDEWAIGFAVGLPQSGGDVLRGFQFFDRTGTAVHKTYLREDSDHSRYEEIVEHFRADVEQAELVEEILANHRTEIDGLPPTGARRQDPDPGAQHTTVSGGYKEFLRIGADEHLKVSLEVSNRGAVQVYTGLVHNLKEARGWFNVLDDGFNLHLREKVIDRCELIRDRGASGDAAGLYCYDQHGRLVIRLSDGQPSHALGEGILDRL